MTTLTIGPQWLPAETKTQPSKPPKTHWPLMGDLVTFRADVPEALIHWRRDEGKPLPQPRVHER